MIESDKTLLEKVTSNTLTAVAATVIATAGATTTPLAALIPVLTTALAYSRFVDRVEDTFVEFEKILSDHQSQLNDISDAQFQLISEIISTTLQTVDSKKLGYLRQSLENSLCSEKIDPKDVTFLARTVRDISVAELKFLIDNFKYKFIIISGFESDETNLHIEPNSSDELIVSGLINLGLLITSIPTIGGVKFNFSPLVAKIIALVTDQKNHTSPA